MSTTSEIKMLKPKEVAVMLAISTSKLYQMIEKKQIGSYQVGGSIRISQEQFERYLANAKQ